MAGMDTLRAYEILRAKGRFEEEPAKAVVEAVSTLLTPSFADLATKSDLAAVKADIEQLRLATKSDLAEVKADIEQLRHETKSDLTVVKADIEQLRQATKADIEQLRLATKADLSQTKVELVKWMVGLLMAQGALIVSLLKILKVLP